MPVTVPSPDYPDFQAQPAYQQVLVSTSIASPGTPFTVCDIPVVAYNALRVAISVGSGGAEFLGQFLSSVGGSVVSTPYDWMIPGTPGVLDVLIPCDGPAFQLVVFNIAGATNASITVYGVTRSVPAASYVGQALGQADVAHIVGAGLTFQDQSNYVLKGPAWFYFNPYSATTAFVVRLYTMKYDNSRRFILYEQFQKAAQIFQNLILPAAVIQVYIQNTDGANPHTCDYALITGAS